MANRRTLKKNINYICTDLAAECVALMIYKPDVPPEDIDNLLRRIFDLRRDFVSRISHTEPGAAKEFYGKLLADFNAQTDDIVEVLSSLS